MNLFSPKLEVFTVKHFQLSKYCPDKRALRYAGADDKIPQPRIHESINNTPQTRKIFRLFLTKARIHKVPGEI